MGRRGIVSGDDHRAIGLGASAMAAVLWGFGSIFVALTFAPGLVLTFYRLWLGAALFCVLVYATGRRLSTSLFGATWLGGILLAGDMALFYSAVKLTSIIDVTVIGAFQPALVMLAAPRIFGERLGRRDVGWILLAMVGVTVAVIGPGTTSHHEVVGDLLAVGSLVSFSAYWLVSKRARQEHGALEYTTGVTIMAALAVTPIVLVSGQSLARVELGDWFWISLLVVVPGGGHLAMNWAHRYVDASISSAISCLAPLVAAVVAIPVLGQGLTFVQVIGVTVGLAAISMIAMRQRLPALSPLE